MKKVFSVLTVAVLAVSTVFAGFSGSANVDLGYNFENGDYGFANGTGVVFDYELTSEAGEAKGEGDVYASIKGSLSLTMGNDPDNPDSDLDEGFPVHVTAAIKEAKVAGENWSVSILGSGKGLNYASSAIDTYKDNGRKLAETFKPAYESGPGVEVSVPYVTAGFGFKGNSKTDAYALNGYLKSDAFELTKGLTLEGGLQAYKANGTRASVAFGGKLAFTNDKMSASVATDMAVSFTKDDAKFDADAAAAFAMDMVSIDVFYATKNHDASVENLLSAKVGLTFDPVKVVVTGKDLVNKQNLGLGLDFEAMEGLVFSVNAGYGIKDEKLSVGAGVDYEGDLFNTGLSVGFTRDFNAEKNGLTLDAYVSTTALIPGAELSLSYGEGAYPAVQNLLDKHYGAVTASCGIAF